MAVNKKKFAAPRIRLEYVDEAREPIEIHTHMGDQIAYERQAKKEGWPALANGEGSGHWVLYMAFVHLKRAQEIDTQTKFDAWAEGIASFENLNDDGEPSEDLATEDPTQPAPTTG